MRIETDDLTGADIQALLREHLADMHAQSPPESCHVLDLSGLRKPGITFWTVRDDTGLLGCGALQELDPTHGEIKSMRTPKDRRRTGAGRAMLEHLIAEARARGYARLSLETGTPVGFIPARTLYARYGFQECGPFGSYREDPYSVFMTLKLVD